MTQLFAIVYLVSASSLIAQQPLPAPTPLPQAPKIKQPIDRVLPVPTAVENRSLPAPPAQPSYQPLQPSRGDIVVVQAGVPILGKVPFIGQLFKNSYAAAEVELKAQPPTGSSYRNSQPAYSAAPRNLPPKSKPLGPPVISRATPAGVVPVGPPTVSADNVYPSTNQPYGPAPKYGATPQLYRPTTQVYRAGPPVNRTTPQPPLYPSVSSGQILPPAIACPPSSTPSLCPPPARLTGTTCPSADCALCANDAVCAISSPDAPSKVDSIDNLSPAIQLLIQSQMQLAKTQAHLEAEKKISQLKDEMYGELVKQMVEKAQLQAKAQAADQRAQLIETVAEHMIEAAQAKALAETVKPLFEAVQSNAVQKLDGGNAASDSRRLAIENDQLKKRIAELEQAIKRVSSKRPSYGLGTEDPAARIR